MENVASRSSPFDVLVVGAGLAGLSAAALIAQAGRSVLVIEQSGNLGGRASTHVRDGICWNLGPHALYCEGHAVRLFKKLDIAFNGHFPNPGRGLLVRSEESIPFPTGFGSLLRTRLLTIREKWRLARLLLTLGQLDTRPFDSVTLRDWLDQTIGPGNLAGFLAALCRLSTYCDDSGRMSAGAALSQLKLVLAGNVWYIDGGWQTLVDGLHDRALALGVEFRTHARVGSVQSDSGVVIVRLASGEELRSRAAVLAVDPAKVCELLGLPGDSPLARWVADAAPIRAASLDLALARLPRPDVRFALGLDRPFYYSVHSASAKLAPEGMAVVHVMKYLGADVSDSSQAVETELESFLEAVQPDWAAHVVARRFLPRLTVAHSLPLASDEALLGRPGVTVAERPHVFIAGDWVGSAGMLADASVASAAESAQRVLRLLAHNPASPRSPLHVES